MAIFQCISSLPNLLQWVKAASEGCCYFPRAGTGGASTCWVTEFLSSAHLLAQMCHLLGEHWPLTEGRTASTMSLWFGPRENKWVGDLATQLHIIKVGPVTITSRRGQNRCSDPLQQHPRATGAPPGEEQGILCGRWFLSLPCAQEKGRKHMRNTQLEGNCVDCSGSCQFSFVCSSGSRAEYLFTLSYS